MYRDVLDIRALLPTSEGQVPIFKNLDVAAPPVADEQNLATIHICYAVNVRPRWRKLSRFFLF